MSITPDVKEKLIKDYATKADDTGSPEVQVAILTIAHQHADRALQDPQEGQPFAAVGC